MLLYEREILTEVAARVLVVAAAERDLVRVEEHLLPVALGQGLAAHLVVGVVGLAAGGTDLAADQSIQLVALFLLPESGKLVSGLVVAASRAGLLGAAGQVPSLAAAAGGVRVATVGGAVGLGQIEVTGGFGQVGFFLYLLTLLGRAILSKHLGASFF